jgi:penicillin V acylase-like amidase (Ntn superfamily)
MRNPFKYTPRIKVIQIILASAVCTIMGMTPARPCTTVLFGEGPTNYFARNLDWNWDEGLVIVNPRNVRKASLAEPGTPAASWTSKYGSVTFNQFGQEMPFGGMNEAGLVVECMWLNETRYAPADNRPSISLLQWIQYQLDNCRNVEEVLATDSKLRLYAPNGSARIHYLVSDATGGAAAIEILNGKMKSHHRDNLPFRALANDTYDTAAARARIDPNASNEQKGSSFWRFSTAAERAARFRVISRETDLHYAFDTLEQVSQGNFTVWSIVYDVSRLQISFQTRKNPRLRSIDLKSLNFSCAQPRHYVHIHSDPDENAVLDWQILTEERHRKYMESFISDAALKHRLGDLEAQVMGQLLMLRNQKCAD